MTILTDEWADETKVYTQNYINSTAQQVNETSVSKGFWEGPVFMDKVVAKLALVHSEVTEVMEALRKSQGNDKVTEEFADIFIRCLDLYKVLVDNEMADPNLQDVIRQKMIKNEMRPVKHGHAWG